MKLSVIFPHPYHPSLPTPHTKRNIRHRYSHVSQYLIPSFSRLDERDIRETERRKALDLFGQPLPNDAPVSSDEESEQEEEEEEVETPKEAQDPLNLNFETQWTHAEDTAQKWAEKALPREAPSDFDGSLLSDIDSVSDAPARATFLMSHASEDNNMASMLERSAGNLSAAFDAMDRNADGVIDREEFRTATFTASNLDRPTNELPKMKNIAVEEAISVSPNPFVEKRDVQTEEVMKNTMPKTTTWENPFASPAPKEDLPQVEQGHQAAEETLTLRGAIKHACSQPLSQIEGFVWQLVSQMQHESTVEKSLLDEKVATLTLESARARAISDEFHQSQATLELRLCEAHNEHALLESENGMLRHKVVALVAGQAGTEDRIASLEEDNSKLRRELVEAVSQVSALEQARVASPNPFVENQKKEEDLREGKLLSEAHAALTKTNTFLMSELENTRARHTKDALQWQKNYNLLREQLQGIHEATPDPKRISLPTRPSVLAAGSTTTA